VVFISLDAVASEWKVCCTECRLIIRGEAYPRCLDAGISSIKGLMYDH